MKFIPILFSTQMVQAILEKRKTMTRRLIKNAPERTASIWHDGGEWIVQNEHNECYIKDFKCKYGNIGDVLWVRETWHPKRHSFPTGLPYEYKATAEKDGTPTNEAWKPSIFMPKDACRLFLKITNIRAERLQDISEEDAINEGIEMHMAALCGETVYGNYNLKGNDAPYFYNPVTSFTSLWESINGKESWDANPFVWVISFEAIDKPENF